jgi:hypothetical protein
METADKAIENYFRISNLRVFCSVDLYRKVQLGRGSRVALRAVRIIVPSAAGDGPGSVAGLIGSSLEHSLGRPFVIVSAPPEQLVLPSARR